MLLIDEEGSIVDANPAAAGWFGIAPVDLVGRPYLDFVRREARVQVAGWHQRLFSSGDRPVVLETAVQLPDGRERIVEIHSGVLGRVWRQRAVLAVLRDVTQYHDREDAAIVAERSRLARDLHDAVLQTLFSANLIASALAHQWNLEPAAASANLRKLRMLTQSALVEMRTLLLDLRPDQLTQDGLGVLLGNLSESVAGRMGVPVRLFVDGEAALPPDVQIAFYRIAQEALNNVSKHAAPQEVTLHLELRDDSVTLRVRDDGRGFEPGAGVAGHLGLKIMHERAAGIGATLRVDSSLGRGTEVSANWRVPERS